MQVADAILDRIEIRLETRFFNIRSVAIPVHIDVRAIGGVEDSLGHGHAICAAAVIGQADLNAVIMRDWNEDEISDFVTFAA